MVFRLMEVKRAAILPGLIGSMVGFIFKFIGSVISFLGQMHGL